jgi:4-amino-4-deoxy-L-arabinose transferase-like glycosyltransferase
MFGIRKSEISVYLESKKTQFAIGIMLSLLYFTLFLKMPHSDLSDTAYYGGDSQDYQAMGVNFAKGHGIQQHGGIEAFGAYKFDSVDSADVKNFYKYYGFNSYRTPAYPLFLGIVYKIVGISPYKAKLVQLLLLTIIAGFLPLIGYYFWKTKGFFSGLIAGPLYLINYYSTADKILTEPLIAFVLFLMLISYIYYETRKSTLSNIILGIMLGIGLLTKGSLLFIPIMVFLYLIRQCYRNRQIKPFKDLLLMFLFFILTILPWSLYASIKSDSIIFLSSQGKHVLMDCNNEYCVDGGWHPEWETTEKSFYRHDGMGDDASPALRVLNFYKSHPSLFPKIMMSKIITGFSTLTYLWVIICLIIMGYYGSLIEKYLKNPFYYLIFIALSVVSITFFVNYQFFIPFKIHLFEILLLFLLPPLLFLAKPLIKIPTLFYFYLSNFFFIAIISFGETRYIGVMSFIFILVAIQSLIEYFLHYLKYFTRKA